MQAFSLRPQTTSIAKLIDRPNTNILESVDIESFHLYFVVFNHHDIYSIECAHLSISSSRVVYFNYTCIFQDYSSVLLYWHAIGNHSVCDGQCIILHCNVSIRTARITCCRNCKHKLINNTHLIIYNEVNTWLYITIDMMYMS